MGRLDNKIALITGASGGMGAAHAKLFIEEGAKVVLADLNEVAGKSLANKLGSNAMFVKLDVSISNDWKNAVKEVEVNFGPINILVNNAGIADPIAPIHEMDDEGYMRMIKINQYSVFLGMKYAFPSLMKTGNASIINISSVSGFIGLPGMVAYDATKFAVRGMTKTAAAEFGKYGIRVNSVHPGAIETSMVTDEEREISKTIPLSRIAEPVEISKLVLFLASDDSSYSSGSEFTADGGMLATY